jgi:hypothetical protein
MEIQENQATCQIPCLQRIAEGRGEVPPQSLTRRLKLAIRRRLSPQRERALKSYSNDLYNRFSTLLGRGSRPAAPASRAATTRVKAGELVRVRSEEEIRATLNHWRQLKGCTFMPEMAPYCGTTQRVFKVMGRFVDERDLQVKRCRGIVLLEGLHCQGTAEFGPCDRSCLYFWREEWLEKLDPGTLATGTTE